MKKMLLMAVIAVAAMSCCNKAAEKKCCGECQKDSACCEAVADSVEVVEAVEAEAAAE